VSPPFELGALPPIEQLLLIAAAAFAASTVAAVAGFGGSAILLPLFVPAFGPRDAVLILTIVQLVGNVSRVVFNRHELVLPVVGWFSLGAVPFAILGGIAFATAPLALLTRLLGGLLIGLVVWRHLPAVRSWGRPGMSLRRFAILGAASSFVSALVGTIGPLLVPFFLAYGLVKGAFIGTEALSTVVIQVVKLGTYAGTAVLTPLSVAVGAGLAPVMIAGSLFGKRVLDGLSDRVFVLIVEATMVIAGITFLLGG
jgi:uncharacterized membrane protein YfcA